MSFEIDIVVSASVPEEVRLQVRDALDAALAAAKGVSAVRRVEVGADNGWDDPALINVVLHVTDADSTSAARAEALNRLAASIRSRLVKELPRDRFPMVTFKAAA
jgi:ribosome-binding factor A